MSCRVVSTTEDSTTSSLSDVASSKLAAAYRPALQPISQPTRYDQHVLVSARSCVSTLRSPCSDHVRICTIVSTCPQLLVLRVNTFSSSAMDMLRSVAPFSRFVRSLLLCLTIARQCSSSPYSNKQTNAALCHSCPLHFQTSDRDKTRHLHHLARGPLLACTTDSSHESAAINRRPSLCDRLSETISTKRTAECQPLAPALARSSLPRS